MTRSIAWRAINWSSILPGIFPLWHAQFYARTRSFLSDEPGVGGRANPQHVFRIRRDVSRKEQQEWFFHLEGPVHETVRQKLASALEVDSLKYLPKRPTPRFSKLATENKPSKLATANNTLIEQRPEIRVV